MKEVAEVSIRLDMLGFTAVEQALNVAVLNSQSVLATIRRQAQEQIDAAQLPAEAPTKPAKRNGQAESKPS